jgi:alpha/beta hydrolase fold
MEKQIGYAAIHGLQMYYEIHGAAHPARPPLVLLHGGGDTIQTSFGHVLPLLARDRQIVAFEQQGFGHTADIADRPFSFAQSADDTAALLDYLQIDQADLFGFSKTHADFSGHSGGCNAAHRRAGTDHRGRRRCDAPRTRRGDVPAAAARAACRAPGHRSHGADEARRVAGADGQRVSEYCNAED